MTQQQHPMVQLLQEDPRYTLEAYQFVRDALSFGQQELGYGEEQVAEDDDDPLANPFLEALVFASLFAHLVPSNQFEIATLSSAGLRHSRTSGETSRSYRFSSLDQLFLPQVAILIRKIRQTKSCRSLVPKA